MKTQATLALTGLLLLTACAPATVYYRQGASVSRLQTDLTDCQVRALRDAPVATEIRQGPPLFWPGRTYCNPAGQCYATPGYWEPGNIYSVDVNADLRGRVEQQCMARRGYQPVTLGRCTQSIRNQVSPEPETRLPGITAQSCVIPQDGGGYRIVTPGLTASKPG